MPDEEPTATEVLERLETLEESLDAPDQESKIQRIRRLGATLQQLERRAFGDVEQRVQRYTTRDVVESFVGSTLFSVPLLVEGGVQDIGEHFATTFVAGVPVYFLVNVIFAVVVTAGLLYYAEFREVEITYVFGLVPRRLAAVLAIAFVTAGATMALWARIDPAQPFLAVCQVSVVWTAGAFGAGLGDILPGESEGVDLGDALESLE